MEPRLIYFDIPGAGQPLPHRVACYQWGDPQAKETVLCIHGLTRNGRDFDFLAEALADNYQVLCPDIAGRGKSQWLKDPAGYNNPAYVAGMVFMLQSLGIPKVHWIGTSMGGMIAMIAANTNPGLIASLVLNDVGCVIPASGLSRIMSLADVQTVFDSRAEAEASFRKRTASFGIRDEKQWQQLFRYGLEEMPDGKIRFTYDPAIFQLPLAQKGPVADVNLWPFWEAIKKIPVLLLRGAESDILTRQTAEEMQSSHPQLTLHEISGVGHAPSLMAGDQIALVKSWLGRASQ